jgi:hypothetical protein
VFISRRPPQERGTEQEEYVGDIAERGDAPPALLQARTVLLFEVAAELFVEFRAAPPRQQASGPTGRGMFVGFLRHHRPPWMR